jgi:hypothetical protein
MSRVTRDPDDRLFRTLEDINRRLRALETRAGGGGGGRTLIATATPGGSGSTTFTGIPGSYRHLEIVVEAHSSDSSQRELYVRFNGDAGNNYVWAGIIKVGGTTVQGEQTSPSTTGRIGVLPGNSSVERAMVVTRISRYGQSQPRLQWISHQYHVTPAGQDIRYYAGQWVRSGSSPPTVAVGVSGASFGAGSVVYLYGLA